MIIETSVKDIYWCDYLFSLVRTGYTYSFLIRCYRSEDAAKSEPLFTRKIYQNNKIDFDSITLETIFDIFQNILYKDKLRAIKNYGKTKSYNVGFSNDKSTRWIRIIMRENKLEKIIN